MKINVNSWHYKLWNFYQFLRCDFHDLEYYKRGPFERASLSEVMSGQLPSIYDDEAGWTAPKPTNFCYYLRCILLWLPLRVLVGVLSISLTFAGFLHLLSLITLSAVVFVVVVIVGSAIVLSAGFGLYALSHYLKESFSEKMEHAYDAGSNSFFVNWYASSKRKICPMLEVEGDE